MMSTVFLNNKRVLGHHAQARACVCPHVGVCFFAGPMISSISFELLLEGVCGFMFVSYHSYLITATVAKTYRVHNICNILLKNITTSAGSVEENCNDDA